MIRLTTAVGAVAVPLFFAVLAAPSAGIARSAIPAVDPNDVNKGVVELETAGSAGISVRMGEDLGPERVRLGVRLIGAAPKRLTPTRRRLIEVLSDGLLHGKSEAAREAGVSVGVIDGLVDEGTLATEVMPRALPPPPPDPSYAQPEFARPQRGAVDAMRTHLRAIFRTIEMLRSKKNDYFAEGDSGPPTSNQRSAMPSRQPRKYVNSKTQQQK